MDVEETWTTSRTARLSDEPQSRAYRRRRERYEWLGKLVRLVAPPNESLAPGRTKTDVVLFVDPVARGAPAGPNRR
jgi:hypothetical protein